MEARVTKLHMWREVGKHWSKFADGEGTISKTEEFNVTLTAGEVTQGYAYQIREGQKETGDMYNCTAGTDKTQRVAKFKYSGALDETETDAEPKSLALVRDFRSLFLATQKGVTIAIDLDDLKVLKASNYRLCFAKKVGAEAYNVVWQSYHDYLAFNEFSWTPMYQLFGSNRFDSDVTVKVSTNTINIGLGEESTLDNVGVLSGAKTGGPSTAITLINDYGSIHPGINQLSTGIDGKEISTPIYVSENPIVSGSVKLTPVERVLVWFEQNIQTSTMFSTARSQSVEIDLTNVNSATRLYQGGQWLTP